MERFMRLGTPRKIADPEYMKERVFTPKAIPLKSKLQRIGIDKCKNNEKPKHFKFMLNNDSADVKVRSFKQKNTLKLDIPSANEDTIRNSKRSAMSPQPKNQSFFWNRPTKKQILCSTNEYKVTLNVIKEDEVTKMVNQKIVGNTNQGQPIIPLTSVLPIRRERTDSKASDNSPYFSPTSRSGNSQQPISYAELLKQQRLKRTKRRYVLS